MNTQNLSTFLVFAIAMMLTLLVNFAAAEYIHANSTSLDDPPTLDSCTTQLIDYVCDSNGCPGFDPSADILTQCMVAADSAVTDDPCGVDKPPNWTYGLHVAAIFVVLVASALGAGVPLLAKYHPGFNLDPYYIMLGKCMGIGVVISCALVHMLQPSNEALTSPCLPYEFNSDYTYAYLYCVLAILAMHAIDFFVDLFFTQHLMKAAGAAAHAHSHVGHPSGDITMVNINVDRTGEFNKPNGDEDDLRAPKRLEDGSAVPYSPTSLNKPLQSPISRPTSSMVDVNANKGASAFQTSHTHSILLMEGVKRTISAYMLEFGVTVHSIFIGLANGITDDQTLHVLLVALCFHQLFEGVALGARIADANMRTHWHEVILALIFSLAAPLGIAIGVAVTISLNPNGETFLMVQGTFDGICAGILLYIGLVLLLRDFPEDMECHCKGKPYEKYRIFGMFVFLYIGAGFMSYIGKYL